MTVGMNEASLGSQADLSRVRLIGVGERGAWDRLMRAHH